MLPEPLRNALDDEAGAYPAGVLAKAADELSEAYRGGRTFRFGADEHRVAYALVRMPATYAVLVRVLSELRDRCPGGAPRSVLDLGSGTGAAAWAAAEVLDPLDRVTLVEEDRRLIELGQRLGAPAEWRSGDVRVAPLEPHDLVTLSYVLGEMEEAAAVRVLRRAWNAAAQALVVIEPGTPRGFAGVRLWRDELIAMGAHVAAPCPHCAACPMPEGDWCHFSRRLERTSLHRKLKHGAVGYEDEKFSYVAVTRAAAEPAEARILRHPVRLPGHVKLRLCTIEGLRDEVVRRGQKEAWRAVRHAAWGDLLQR